MRRYGHPAIVRWTADLDDGLDGAGAVLIQLRIGGQAARHRDETWPGKCGCLRPETTRAGGVSQALPARAFFLCIDETSPPPPPSFPPPLRLPQPGRVPPRAHLA